MKKLDENKLDQVFNDGLTDAKGKLVDFREEDWVAMEALLDKKENRKKAIVWFYWASGSIAALLLLFLGLNWFNYSDIKPNKPLTNTHRKHNVPGNNNLKPNNKAGYPADNAAGLQYPIEITITGLNKAKNLADSKEISQQNPGVSAESLDSLTNVSATLLPSATVGMANFDAHQLTSGLVAPVGTIRSNNVHKDTLAWLAATVNEEKPKLKRRLALSAALLTAPDLNKAGSGGQNKLGGNAGLQVSAHVSSRWSVTTGASYAIKPYRIGPTQNGALAQYFAVANGQGVSVIAARNSPAISEAGQGKRTLRTLAVVRPATLSTTNGADILTGVMANCTVLDIPININYQVVSSAKRSLSAGAGLSSYFMLTENYRFNYADNSVRELHISNQNQHILGVLNINTTYQQQMSTNLKLLVQPYLKLPITQIGQEQVNLQSTGIAVGISWNLGSAKPK